MMRTTLKGRSSFYVLTYQVVDLYRSPFFERKLKQFCLPFDELSVTLVFIDRPKRKSLSLLTVCILDRIRIFNFL